jgi:uncharacterized repeat protein (TIGR01451 family)
MMRKLLVVAAMAVFMMGSYLEGFSQSIQIGTNQFASNFTSPSLNDYGPMRTRGNGPSAARYAFIYPASLLTGIPVGSEISSIEFSRGGSVSSVASSLTPLQGTPNMKIYLRNVTINDYGAGNIHWVNRANDAKLVFNGNPAAFVDSTNGFKRIVLDSIFVYQAGSNIEMLIEYTQTVGQLGDIRWFYNSDGAVPQYLPNTTKTILVDSANFPSDSTNFSNLRKPTVRFNFPAQINMACEITQSQQLANIGDEIIPSVVIKNTGLQTASNITVTANFPAASYVSTRQVTSVLKDSINLVAFDPITVSSVLSGQITYVVSVSNDGFIGDDTLRADMIFRDPNATPGKFDNGPLITHPGQGANGLDLSRFGPILSLFGSNANNGSFKIVDDFVLPAGSNWTIDSLGFFAYQTGSPPVSTFNGLYVTIYDGDPSDGGQVVAGDDNVSNLIDNMYFTGIYRASNTSPLDSTRPIIKLLGVFFSPVTLTGGQRYWMEWGFTGTINSGPWQPAVSVVGINATGNAYQKTSAGYQPMDGGGIGGYRQGAPFEVHYTINTTSVAEQTGNMRTGQVYPNPATNLAHLSVALRSDEQIRLEITDLNGRVIRSLDQGMLTAGAHTINIETSDLPAGFYLLKVQGQNQLAHRKFQVIK